MNEFQDLTFYDAPSVALNNLLNGQDFQTTFIDSFIRQDNLTPAQRIGVTESIKDKYAQGNSVARAAIGAATNPLTLFFLAFGPGASAAGRAGQAIFGGLGKQLTKKILNNSDFLDSLGMAHYTATVEGTAMESVMEALTTNQNKLMNEVLYEKIEGPIEKLAIGLSKKTGQNIDPSALLRQGGFPERIRGDVFEVNTLIRARLEKRSENREKILTFLKKGKEGDVSVEYKTIEIPALTSETALNTRIKELKDQFGIDIDETANAMRNAYDDMAARLFLKKDKFDAYVAGGRTDRSLVEVDGNKIKRIFGGLSDPDRNVYTSRSLGSIKNGSKTSDSSFADEAVRFIFGDDIVAGTKEVQKLSEKQFKQFIEGTYKFPILEGDYVPRNSWSAATGQFNTIDATRRNVDLGNYDPSRLGKDIEELRRSKDGVDVDYYHRAGFAFGKKVGNERELAHPDVYKYFADLDEKLGFSPNADLIELHTNALNRAEARFNPATGPGRLTAFDDFQVLGSADRFFRGASLQHSLHVLGDGSLKSDVLGALSFRMKSLEKGEGYQELIQSGELKGRSILDIPIRKKTTPGVETTKSAGDVTVGTFFDDAPDGGYSLADMLYRELQILKPRNNYNSSGYRFTLDVILPRLTGDLSIKHAGHYAAIYNSKRFISELANPNKLFGSMLNKAGKFGQDLRQSMEDLGDPNILADTAGRSVAANIAKYLYGTHLGLNLGSVALQMTQPFLHLSAFVGVDKVLTAYGKAFKEMGGYFSERSGQGFRALNRAEKTDLIKKHFSHMADDSVYGNVLNITDDTFRMFDETIGPDLNPIGATRRNAKYWLTEAPMKLFEKAEIMNRLVAAHAVDDFYRANARAYKGAFTKGSPMYYQRLFDVQSVVNETQFGGNQLNTAKIFLGEGPIGRAGDVPYLKQFMSFPTRSLTSLFRSGRRIGEGKRFLRGTDIELPFNPAIVDLGRMLGISAVVYEVGKEVLGADVERGLAVGALTDAFPDITREGSVIPIPPVIDAPLDIARGLLNNDPEFTGLSLGRLLPSGVGLTRILGTFKSINSNDTSFQLPSALQRRYVDWDKPNQEGNYPIFSSDGRFIEFQGGPEIILNGLGLKTISAGEGGKLDGYLMKQRQNIRDTRKRAIAALMANDIPKYESIKSKFERDFTNPDTGESIPLTFTKRQIKDYVKNYSVARSERILQGISPELRGLFQQQVAGRSKAVGVPKEVISNTDIATSTARNKYFNRAQNLNLDPETIAKVRAIIEEADREKQFSSPTFQSYGGFAK